MIVVLRTPSLADSRRRSRRPGDRGRRDALAHDRARRTAAADRAAQHRGPAPPARVQLLARHLRLLRAPRRPRGRAPPAVSGGGRGLSRSHRVSRVRREPAPGPRRDSRRAPAVRARMGLPGLHGPRCDRGAPRHRRRARTRLPRRSRPRGRRRPPGGRPRCRELQTGRAGATSSGTARSSPASSSAREARAGSPGSPRTPRSSRSAWRAGSGTPPAAGPLLADRPADRRARARGRPERRRRRPRRRPDRGRRRRRALRRLRGQPGRTGRRGARSPSTRWSSLPPGTTALPGHASGASPAPAARERR